MNQIMCADAFKNRSAGSVLLRSFLMLLFVLMVPGSAFGLDWLFVPVTGSQTASSTTDFGTFVEARSTLQVTNGSALAIEDVHFVPYGTCLGPVSVAGCTDPGTRLTWNDVAGRWESGPSWMEAQSVAFSLLIDPAVTNLPVVPGWNYSAGDSLPAVAVGNLGPGQSVSQEFVFHFLPLQFWGYSNFFVGKPVECGNGVLTSGEQCDDGNTVDGDCCSSTCTIESAGTVCRAAVDPICDVVETCDGVSPSCPADVTTPDGTTCTDTDACTTGDQCTSGMCTPTGNVTMCVNGDGCCPAGCTGFDDDDCPLTGIAVVPTKLIVVDKMVVASKAKAVFVAKDAAVTKGAGTDAEQIAVTFDVAYGNGSAMGSFVVPAGSANGWLANKASVAKYVNKAAPGGPTEAKVAVIKPGKLLKLVGKGLGDSAIDVLGAGDPLGSVYTAYCVDNAGELSCHCSEFTGCIYKSIAGGTGAKLVCKTGAGDVGCTAIAP